ncbi:MAG: DUF1579 family protein [Ferruginibacter sp.]
MKNIMIALAYLVISVPALAQSKADSAFYNTKQSQWLTKKTGSWNVTMTLQPFINTPPQTVSGLEAERTMIGAFCMHEVMHPAKNAPMQLFERVSDLDYNRDADRWDYMSIDTRITGGIMYFTNFSRATDSIVSFILNFTHPGFGPQLKDRGKDVKVKNVIIATGPNDEIVKQYWKLADGEEWLAVQYDYTRKK